MAESVMLLALVMCENKIGHSWCPFSPMLKFYCRTVSTVCQKGKKNEQIFIGDYTESEL